MPWARPYKSCLQEFWKLKPSFKTTSFNIVAMGKTLILNMEVDFFKFENWNRFFKQNQMEFNIVANGIISIEVRFIFNQTVTAYALWQPCGSPKRFIYYKVIYRNFDIFRIFSQPTKKNQTTIPPTVMMFPVTGLTEFTYWILKFQVEKKGLTFYF